MFKLFILIAVVCLSLVSTVHGRDSGERRRGPGPQNDDCIFGGKLGSQLCSDVTKAQSFVAQVRDMITNLTNNGSFTNFLQQHTQAIAYIQNTANDPFISSNCTGYFASLNAANTVDVNNQKQIEKFNKIASGALKSILTNLASYSGGYGDGHRRR